MKKVYLLNEQGQYIGEGVESFGISYVNKTEVAPDEKFLNGKYDVVWNGKEWTYTEIKEPEPEKPAPEPTEEELKAMEEEQKRMQEEYIKANAKELFPHFIEMLASSEEFKTLVKGAQDANKSV